MNVKRAFSRNNKRTKPSTVSPQNDWMDVQVSKARHIFGLNAARTEFSQDGSTSSTSTRKLQSVTFSEATTAPVHAAHTVNEIKAEQLCQILEPQTPIEFPQTTDPVCQRKPSDLTLRSRASDNSIQSFYDKSQAPLSISQQTSDSSSRDFALRRGAPSVLAESVQETEHLRQLRLASGLDKRSSRDLRSTSRLSVRQDEDLTVTYGDRLTASDTPTRAASLASRKSRSRISIIRGNAPADDKVVVPIRHTLKHEQRSRHFQPPIDPTRAKVNVRRPKAGTKNWFDDVDSESDEELKPETEHISGADFAIRVENAFEQGNFDMIPPRTSSRLSKAIEPDQIQLHKKQKPSEEGKVPSKSALVGPKADPVKRHRFMGVNLQEQSVLYLSSSEDEEEGQELAQDRCSTESAKPVANLLTRRKQPISVEEDLDRIDSEAYQVSALRIRVPEILAEESMLTPPIPRRNSGRLMTHLEDDSTDNLTRGEDLLTSFPPTPTDTFSRHTSFQSADYESSNQRNTRLISLTKQEESLIAALRSKKFAMQKVEAMAHRQDALRILELENGHMDASSIQFKNHTISPLSPISPLRFSYRPNTVLYSPTADAYRPSMEERFECSQNPERSNRSSMATYMTDISQDLQSLSESIHHLPTRASTGPRSKTSRSKLSQRSYQDLLSATTSTCTTPRSTRSKHESVKSTRDYRFDSNDAVDRGHFRDAIPSQLFMERPYVGWQGWEGRAGELQMLAH